MLDRARGARPPGLSESRSRTLSTEDLMTIEAGEIRATHVFEGGIEPAR
jgi:hypothetical protein